MIERGFATRQWIWGAALSVVIEQVTTGKGEERHGGGKSFMAQPWVALAKKHGVGFLTGQAEKKWIEAETSMIATDDARYVREVAGAIAYSLMALLWLTMPSGTFAKPNSQFTSPATLLRGAWPLVQPPTTPKTLLWPSPDTMRNHELVVSIQNTVLHMAQKLCARLVKMGVVPPVPEFYK